MAKRGWADLLALGRPALGTWAQIASEEIIDMLGASGLDYAIVDMEHGAFGIETAERLFRACDANGLVPLVRTARPDPWLIGQVLDAGAAAVVVPGVSSAAQARELVAAARFGPEGTRGACPCVRAGGHFVRNWRGYESSQNGPRVIALVETAAGLADIEAICAVEGLAGLLIGPFDLSVSLGQSGDYLAEPVARAIDRMSDAATANGLPILAPIFDPDPIEARRQRDLWQQRGATNFVIGTDKIIFSAAVDRYRHALAG